MSSEVGVIFRDQNITADVAAEILKAYPRFVGLPSEFEIDTEIEKELLRKDIVRFERLRLLGSNRKEPVSARIRVLFLYR